MMVPPRSFREANKCFCFIFQDCLVSFSYPVGTESDKVFGGDWGLDDVAMEPFRTVMIIPYSKLEHVIDSLEIYLKEKN